MLTRQEVFDKAVIGVLRQGQQSLNEDLCICRYRGPNGLKCAAGQLILDEHFDAELEGFSAASKPITTALSKSGVSNEDIGMVQSLQTAHDGAFEPFVKNFFHSAVNIAKRNLLSITEITKVYNEISANAEHVRTGESSDGSGVPRSAA